MIRLRCGNQRIRYLRPSGRASSDVEGTRTDAALPTPAKSVGSTEAEARLAAKVKRAAVEGAAGIICHGPSRPLGLAANLVDHSIGENPGTPIAAMADVIPESVGHPVVVIPRTSRLRCLMA